MSEQRVKPPRAYRELGALLDERRAAPTPEARATVDARIDTRFRRELAILVLDMSGFSRITKEEGIIHFLEMIHRMHDLTRPVVREHGGEVVKLLADNLFAVFHAPADAARAADAIHRACDEDAAGRPPNERVKVSIGLGYGDMLYLDGMDCFGDEVNLAFKLGEDIATGGTTLATEALVAELPAAWPRQRDAVYISEIHLPFFRLR
jgi:adenylate cyclase